MNDEKIPKVFISYSWDDNTTISHDAWNLAEKFRNNGIKSMIDQDHGGVSPTPNGGWKSWMEKNIENADYIVILCTESYYQKSKHKVGVSAGRGVKREWLLIDSNLYDNNDFTKYIPMYYKEDTNKFIPTIIKNDCTSYVLDSDKDIKMLIDYLTGNNKKLPPVKITSDKGVSTIENKEDVAIADKVRNVEIKTIPIKKNNITLGTVTLKTVPVEVDGKILNVSIYPVTFEEYDLFCEDVGKSNSFLKGYENEPVVNVDWNDAYLYCEWLSKKINRKCKLIDSKVWKHIVLENSITEDTNISEWCENGNESEKKLKIGSQIELVDLNLKNLKIGFRYNILGS